MNYSIQANASGTRSIEISEQHLETIKEYALFKNLVDSNGIIDEGVLEKLRLNVRSLLDSQKETDKALLGLCFDVIYHPNMKALGLHNLAVVYAEWCEKEDNQESEDESQE